MISRERLKKIKLIYVSYSVLKYILFQLQLGIATLRDLKDDRATDAVPVPPARLRHRVHGSLDRESFLETGRIVAQNIRDLCAAVGQDIYSFDNILDFGSGSGRVLRNFQGAPDTCRFSGSDIDPELVKWCKDNLPGVDWNLNGYRPPLSFADNTFDLVYAVSVFTHLDAKYQQLWLREIRRITKPGGIVILTVHGDAIIDTLPPSMQSRVRQEGFLFVKGATGRLKLNKLPDFYQTTYQTQEYVRREWASYFDVVQYMERGINKHQDAVVLRKPRSSEDDKTVGA